MKVYTVQIIAEIAGISVRTLHYYDQIGLLRPIRNDANGYRMYDEHSLARLQHILFFKELEFSLEDIKKMIDSPDFDQLEAFEEQKRLLTIKRKRIDALIETLNNTINVRKGGENMSDDTPFQVLSDDQLEAYKNEAKKRWGHTDAYQQSVKRTQNWTRDDIKRVQQEWQQLLSAVAETMDRGVDSVETQKEIEAIYQHLHQFYDPSPELFEGLGTMYVEDSRFHETFEKIKPGLAEYTRDAIKHFVSVRYT